MNGHEMSVRDLARITLRMAAVAAIKEGKQELDVALGHVRDAYEPLSKKGSVLRKENALPFTEAEWQVLEDVPALWSAMKAELGIHDARVRIMVPVNHVPLDEWNRHMTTGMCHTFCFGMAMRAFGMLS